MQSDFLFPPEKDSPSLAWEREKMPPFKDGQHNVRVCHEMAPKFGEQRAHVFLLKNAYGQVWFSCFCDRWMGFAEACQVPLTGRLQMKDFLGKWVRITTKEKPSKDGRSFVSVEHYEPLILEQTSEVTNS